MDEDKKSEPLAIHVADDIHALLNHKQCERHKDSDSEDICGWPEVSLPSPASEDDGPEKLNWPEDESRRVSKEAVETIVSAEVRAYLLRVAGASFSAEELTETTRLFFSHSALTQKQLTRQFQRANLRSLQVFVETLKSGVYPSQCFLLGPQYKPEMMAVGMEVADSEAATTVEKEAVSEKEAACEKDAAGEKDAAIDKEAVPEKEVAPAIPEKADDPALTQKESDTTATNATNAQPEITTSETDPTNKAPTGASVQPCSAAGGTYKNGILVDSFALPVGDVAIAAKLVEQARARLSANKQTSEKRQSSQPSPPYAKRHCTQATPPSSQNNTAACSPELADLQQRARYILHSDVRASYPHVLQERQQLEQSLYFIDYFRKSNGEGAGIDFFTQEKILLERGRENLDKLQAAMQKLTDGFNMGPQQVTPPPFNNCVPSPYHTPQASQPTMMTPPHYAGSPPQPQPPLQPLWSRAEYNKRVNAAIQAASQQKAQKAQEAAMREKVLADYRRYRDQEKARQKQASDAAKRSQMVLKTAANSASNTAPATATVTTDESKPSSFNPMAPVFKPVVRKVATPAATPGVAPTPTPTEAKKVLQAGRKPLPQLPGRVLKKIFSYVDLDGCMALADTSTQFRRVIRKGDKSFVRKMVQSRTPWATSLASSVSNYTTWFDFARVIISRAKKMSSGGSSWSRVSSLDSVPRSLMTYVDPVEVQGRVDFEPVFDDAFLMPYMTQRDGPSLVHLQGNKIFTDHVSVELKTFKVEQGVIHPKEIHLPQEDALFTRRGTKVFINSTKDTAIQFVDENDRLLWVKDGTNDVFVNKSRAPKNKEGIIMYNRQDASNTTHSFKSGQGKLLGGSSGAIGIMQSSDDSQYHVCYFPLVTGSSKAYCLASFSGYGHREDVFKTLDFIVYNGMLHINLFNTMVPFWADLKFQASSTKTIGGIKMTPVYIGVSPTMKAFRLADNSQKTIEKTRHLEHSTLRSRCGRFVSASLSRGRVVGDLLTGKSFCVRDDDLKRPNFVFPYLNGQKPAFIKWERKMGIAFFNQLSSDLTQKGHQISFVMKDFDYNLKMKKIYRFTHYDPAGPELDGVKKLLR